MKTKLLVCMLTVCMILMLVPALCFSASAASGPVATVMNGEETVAKADTLVRALNQAAGVEGCTVVLNQDIMIAAGFRLAGTYTIDLNGHTITAHSPLVAAEGTVTITDSSEGAAGGITGAGCAALELIGGNLVLKAGTFTSNTEYAVVNAGEGKLYLTGTPKVQKQVYALNPATVYGSDGAEDPTPYAGEKITVVFGWNIDENPVVVVDGDSDQFDAPVSGLYTSQTSDGNMIVSQMGYVGWGINAGIILVAVLFVVIALVTVAKTKKKINKLNAFAIPAVFPFMQYLSSAQKWVMVIGVVLVLASIIYCIVSCAGAKKKLKKAKVAHGITPEKEKAMKAAEKAAKQAAKDAKKKGAPVAEAAETAEAVAEEAPAAEVAEEAPAAEVAEEAPAAEVAEGAPAAEVAEEAPAAEVAEEAPAAEVAEEAPAAEVAEEAPAAEVAEEVPAAEVVKEAPAAEVVEEVPAAEVVKEAPAAKVAEEAPAAEVVEEVPAAEVAEEAPAAEVVEEVPAAEVVKEAPAAKVAPTPVAEKPAKDKYADLPKYDKKAAKKAAKEAKKAAKEAKNAEPASNEPAELTDAQRAALEAEERKAAKKAAAEEAIEAPVEEAVEETVEAPVEVLEEAPTTEAAESIEAPVEDIAEEDDAEEDAKELKTLVIAPVVDAEGKTTSYTNYKKSFLARVVLSSEDVQTRYNELKNALLSYKKVNSRISWGYESIKSGRAQLAKFAVCGKTLCLFLALDPVALKESKYNVSDKGDSKKYEAVPCCLRLTSKRSLKWGLELIAMLAEKEQLVANPKYKSANFLPEAKTDEEMLAMGLIKQVQ